MSCSEFNEWLAYFKIEPFEPRRADWRAAMLAQNIVNSLLANMRAEGRMKLEDFLPVFFAEQMATDDSSGNASYQRSMELLQKAEFLTALFGGQDLRNHDDNDHPTGDSAGQNSG